MVLVEVPAGEYNMGSQESAADLVKAFPASGKGPEYFADEYPSHPVRITHPFYMGRYEVTVGEFKQFIEDSGYKTEAEADGEGGWGYDAEAQRCVGRRPRFSWRDAGYPQTDHFPVINVSWNDAVAFCQWLSKKDGRAYRLPTEAEWEYADRAGMRTRYSSGDSPSTLPEIGRMIDPVRHPQFGHVQEIEILSGDGTAFPVAVGGYKPNAFGLYDMHGNAWEWTNDWYGEDYYSKSPVDDPKGPLEGDVKVRRGGGWNSFPLWARSAFRNWNSVDSRCVNLGFRVVATKSQTN